MKQSGVGERQDGRAEILIKTAEISYLNLKR
jgi:hypothetical protein